MNRTDALKASIDILIKQLQSSKEEWRNEPNQKAFVENEDSVLGKAYILKKELNSFFKPTFMDFNKSEIVTYMKGLKDEWKIINEIVGKTIGKTIGETIKKIIKKTYTDKVKYGKRKFIRTSRTLGVAGQVNR